VPLWKRLRRRFFTRRGVRSRAVQTLAGIRSPELGNARNVSVYVPPSYDGAGRRHYPVIYLQDGQNLFDRSTSHAGDWGLVDRLDAMAATGVEIIAVGVWNISARRLDEYSPFKDPRHGGGDGESYLAFVADTLKPIIDRRFKTRPAAADTGIGGSSMGALISLYGLLRRPGTFGFASVQSPSAWFADRAIIRFVQSVQAAGPVYVDVGAGEGDRVVDDVRRLRDALRSRGYREGVDLMYEEDAAGAHDEAAWGRRFPDALAFLLSRPGRK
jgi:predicted alpha/beta superfamily hydrolase